MFGLLSCASYKQEYQNAIVRIKRLVSIKQQLD